MGSDAKNCLTKEAFFDTPHLGDPPDCDSQVGSGDPEVGLFVGKAKLLLESGGMGPPARSALVQRRFVNYIFYVGF